MKVRIDKSFAKDLSKIKDKRLEKKWQVLLKQ